MDGTLIDSEPFWIEAEQALAARFGVEWTHADGMTLVGNPLSDSAQILRARGIDLPDQEIIDTMIDSVTASVHEAMPWMPDAKRLLDDVHAAGIRCALVTMSQGRFVEAFLAVAGEYFEVVVSGEDVARGKPDPEAYLRAAELMGVDARDCVAIEDSPAGATSAYRAGATTIAVKRYADLPHLPGITYVEDLQAMSVGQLRTIASTQPSHER